MLQSLNARLNGVLNNVYLGMDIEAVNPDKNGHEVAKFIKSNQEELEYEYDECAWKTTAVESRGVRDFIVSIPVDGSSICINGGRYEDAKYVYDKQYHEKIEYITPNDVLQIIQNRGPASRAWTGKLRALNSLQFDTRQKTHAAFYSSVYRINDTYDIWVENTFNPKAWCRYALVKTNDTDRDEWRWDIVSEYTPDWKYAISFDEFRNTIFPALQVEANTS
jgi:hypothetical protein